MAKALLSDFGLLRAPFHPGMSGDGGRMHQSPGLPLHLSSSEMMDASKTNVASQYNANCSAHNQVAASHVTPTEGTCRNFKSEGKATHASKELTLQTSMALQLKL